MGKQLGAKTIVIPEQALWDWYFGELVRLGVTVGALAKAIERDFPDDAVSKRRLERLAAGNDGQPRPWLAWAIGQCAQQWVPWSSGPAALYFNSNLDYFVGALAIAVYFSEKESPKNGIAWFLDRWMAQVTRLRPIQGFEEEPDLKALYLRFQASEDRGAFEKFRSSIRAFVDEWDDLSLRDQAEAFKFITPSEHQSKMLARARSHFDPDTLSEAMAHSDWRVALSVATSKYLTLRERQRATLSTINSVLYSLTWEPLNLGDVVDGTGVFQPIGNHDE